MGVSVRVLSKEESEDKIFEIANLRIKTFLEFPYIYDGSNEYEVKYLGRYLKAENARFVGAFSDTKKLVGVATCLPLNEEELFVKQAFIRCKIDLDNIFYFGESVLLPEYRGLGVGHRFFDLREEQAIKLGFNTASFCAVNRPDQHPMRPKNYRSLDNFWLARGYEKKESITTEFEWKDIDQLSETKKSMVFWMKSLR